MTTIITNKVKTAMVGLSGIKTVSFDHLNHKVYAAQKIQSMCGFFVSTAIDAGETCLGWKDMACNYVRPYGTDILIYVKSSSDEFSLKNASWQGPYFNAVTDISEFKGRCLQFMVALCNYGVKSDYGSNFVPPVFNGITLSYYSSSTAAKFYTKAFDLGFVPKHVLLTYNGTALVNSITRFAISGFDSIDPSDYQYIDANKIVELGDLSIVSNKIKLLIEMIGDAQVPVVIHEVSLMFSGEAQLRLNIETSSSTSSSSFSSETSDSSVSIVSESSLGESLSSDSSGSASSDSSSSISSDSSDSGESSSSSTGACGIGCMIIDGIPVFIVY